MPSPNSCPSHFQHKYISDGNDVTLYCQHHKFLFQNIALSKQVCYVFTSNRVNLSALHNSLMVDYFSYYTIILLVVSLIATFSVLTVLILMHIYKHWTDLLKANYLYSPNTKIIDCNLNKLIYIVKFVFLRYLMVSQNIF